MQRAQEKHTNYFRFRHRLASGAIRDVDVYSSPILIGKRKLLASVIHDVTAHRQTQEALAQAGATLQSMLAATTDGVWLLNREGGVLDVNERYAVMTGYTREELLRMALAGLEAGAALDDPRLDIPRVLELGYQRFETRRRTKSGAVLDLEISAMSVPISACIVVFLRDISARKQSERQLAVERNRLQQIIEMLPEGLILYNLAGERVSLNRAATALLGANLLGLPLAHDYRDSRRVDGTLYERNELPVMRSMRTGEVVVGEQMLLRNLTTGGETPILTSSAPLRADDGSIEGGMAVLQDISSIKELEWQRDRMLSLVTHDLRNPLTSISGMSTLLQQQVEQLDEPVHGRFIRGLKTIESAAERMTEQISDLLDYTSASAGRALQLSLEPTDIVAMVRSVLEEQQHATTLHRLELRCTEESIVAAIDRRRLGRAVANLVVNAIKYSPRGGPVTVSVARVIGPDGPGLSIEVADCGIGIPQHDQPHVFEQYYRASNVSSDIPGNGIGLAGVRHIALSHRGTVSLESTEGVGTTATIRLPLFQDAGG
jgi:two-component system phosphate regulon sensor histidine kinase PhoR